MSLPPSLTLHQAAARIWPALIVGAGPAGALLAGLLARQGVATLLVDRAAFPRFKVCGACLNGRALAALAAAGLAELPSRLGAGPLTALHLAAGGRSVRLPLPCGAALSRDALDAALVGAAMARGAHFLPSTSATLGRAAADCRTVRLRGDGEVEVSAKVVFAADGLAGGLLARAGAPSVPAAGARLGAGVVVAEGAELFVPGIIWMAWGNAGYVGAVRLEDGQLDVACALDAEVVRRAGGPGVVAARTLREAGLPTPPRLELAPWRGTPPLTRQPRRVAHHRLFLLGDATGYVEPFTGEGMAWAMSSAVALAPLALGALTAWRPEWIAAWSARHRRVVRRRQLACRLVAAALRRPWLAGPTISVLNRLPGLAAPVVAHLNQTADLRPAAPGVR